MHRVVKSHLDTFVENHGLLELSEATRFEAFVAYCLAKNFTFDAVDPRLLIHEGDEPGLDSVFFVLNEKILTSLDEAKAAFALPKNNNEVSCVFVQAKSGESWKKQEINTFESASLDFVSDSLKHSYNDVLKERRAIFEEIVRNVGKVRGGRPDFYAYFCTTAGASTDKEIVAARDTFRARIVETGLFESNQVDLLDRERILALWQRSTGSYNATFPVFGSAAFPKAAGIEESYVVTCSAVDFVKRVLTDDNGNLRRSLFDENVRDFIDFDDSEINAEIKSSLQDKSKSKRFGLMNNGLTVISPDVRLQANEIYIGDYQIVNGCQTSNVLFSGKDNLTSDTTLTVKIVETSDQDIVDDIVRASNRQNKIEDHQFLATLDTIKMVERYFAARGSDEEHRLYFERRLHQYGRDAIPSIRIFDIRELARCTGAMFFDRPDLASRYPSQLIQDMHETVFNKNNREEIFYASAFSLYRLKLHNSNQRFDSILNKYKWYTLMALRHRLLGSSVSDPRSPRVEKDCERIIRFVAQADEDALKVWNDIAERLKTLGEIDRDRVRTTRFVSEVREVMSA